jgi:hypothetical protein
MEKDSVRLARMEERQINQGNMLADFIESQGKHNENFYETRHQVIAMQAKQDGAWKTVGIFGTLTVGVAGFVSWLITTFAGKQ